MSVDNYEIQILVVVWLSYNKQFLKEIKILHNLLAGLMNSSQYLSKLCGDWQFSAAAVNLLTILAEAIFSWHNWQSNQ
jgi:hypothetical protein